ncbi:DUF7344 domain-containing protein [Salinirubrum litoreum]|uniref:DUF7344 domain-containing protein n=1 Tax=Salinirubrum litoreum TaxID=1126234 RepID=A0ABD5R8P7_9EURY|nr:hypothetical protein [Salinirubrum litoreum]
MAVTDRLDESEVYDILRNDRRRFVIEHLKQSSGRATVGSLADQLASEESGESPPPKNVRQSVYVSLHQTHLPRLDEAGVVAYDPDSKEVELLDGADAVTVYMEVVEEYGLSTNELYVALSVLGLLSVLASLVAVPGFGWVAPTLVGAGFLAIIALTATYYAIQQGDGFFERFRRGDGRRSGGG